MNITRSTLKLFLAKVGASVVQFGAIVYFARELGPAPLGIFFLFQAVLGFLSIPTDIGLRAAVNKRISEGDAPGTYLSSAILIKTGLVIFTAATILLLAPFFDDYIGATVTLYLAVGIVLREFAHLSMATLEGELRVGETAELQFAKQMVWAIVGVILTFAGFGVFALIYGLLAGFGVVFVWGWYKSSITLNRPTITHGRSLINYGKFMLLYSVGGYVYNWIDILIIGFFLTKVHVGAYEVAWRVTSIILLLTWSITKVMFPQVSKWASDGSTDKIRVLVRQTISASLFLVIPAFVGALLLSREILGLVFGTEFELAALVLVILAGEKIVQAFYSIFSITLQAVNRPDLSAISEILTIFLNITLNIVLVLEFGIVGAAIATLLSFVVNAFINGYYLSKYVTIDLPLVEITVIVIAASVMGVLIGSFKSIILVDSVFKLISTIAIGVVIYVILALTSSQIRASIRKNIDSIVS